MNVTHIYFLNLDYFWPRCYRLASQAQHYALRSLTLPLLSHLMFVSHT
jgi:hypothetical protein